MAGTSPAMTKERAADTDLSPHGEERPQDASRTIEARPAVHPSRRLFQVGYSRLGHVIVPISGKPGIGAPPQDEADLSAALQATPRISRASGKQFFAFWVRFRGDERSQPKLPNVGHRLIAAIQPFGDVVVEMLAGILVGSALAARTIPHAVGGARDDRVVLLARG